MLTPQQYKEIYKQLFKSSEGEKILEDLGKRFNMESTSYVPNSDETIYREGQRSVLIFIHRMITDTKLIEENIDG
tara:strand:+ start:719 stop:943 length:225 start_codon:yes stop_codon:yes gene_type:complete